MSLLLALLAGCDGASILELEFTPDPDYGPIEPFLSESQKTWFPGFQTGVSGSNRTIPIIHGFWEGKPMSSWLVGSQNAFAAPKSVGTFYVFCKTGDMSCPVQNGTWNAVAQLGHPVLDHIPGQAGYSPFWQVMTVRVPDKYRPNSVKTVESIMMQYAQGIVSLETLTLQDEALLRTSQPAPALFNGPVIIDGTALQDNGADLFGQPGVKSQEVPVKVAWHSSQRVKYLDFAVGEGFFAAERNAMGQYVMPTQQAWLVHRACPQTAIPSVCAMVGDTGSPDPGSVLAQDAVSVGKEPVFELMLSLTANQNIDLDGDGDTASSNNVIASLGPESLGLGPLNPRDKIYSPLQELMSTEVNPASDATFRLLDTEMNMLAPTIQVRSVGDVRYYNSTSDLTDPVNIHEAVRIVIGGQPPIFANGGNLFVNAPTQLPAQ